MSNRVAETVRVSTLELFFDLVFVFTITQLTTVLVADPGAGGQLPAVLMLGVTWWMYDGYAWLTNAVPPDTTVRRLLLIAGMGGFLVMALAIPKAFDGNGIAFGIGYLVVTIVHIGLFSKSGTQSVVGAILRFAPYNLASAILVLVAAAVGGTAEYVLWAAAFVLQMITPVLTGTEGFIVQAAHFVERHGLVVIIAFGESIVAIGIGAAPLPMDGALAGVAVLGLALTGCLWWSYFTGDDEAAERSLGGIPHDRRPRAALLAYGYAHLVLLYGIIVLAAGMKKAVGHAFEHASPATAWLLAAGVALFLLGDVLFRLVLSLPRNGFRLGAAAVALATVPLGLNGAVAAQLGTLVVILAAMLIAERLTGGDREHVLGEGDRGGGGAG
jgi:low temperature requirement protein LtrA